MMHMNGLKRQLSCSANDTLAVIILYLQDHVAKNSDSLPSVVTALRLLLLDRSSKQVNKHLANNCGKIEMLWSKIRCPTESNPAWRWHSTLEGLLCRAPGWSTWNWKKSRPAEASWSYFLRPSVPACQSSQCCP